MRTHPRSDRDHTHERLVSRRGFLKGTAATAGILALGDLGRAGMALSQPTLPSPDASGIEHVVVVMMENRSFDHFLGWLPDADGRQKGLRYVDDAGVRAQDLPARARLSGLRAPRSRSLLRGRARRVQRRRVRRLAARGRQRPIRDRLLHAERSGLLRRRRPHDWTICDRYFSADHGARRTRTGSTSTPRRPIGITNTLELSTLPTIWDRLADGRPRRPLLLQRRAVPRAVGREVPADRAHLRRVPRRRGRGHAAARLLRRSALPRARSRALRRRPPARRHPQRPGVPQPRLPRGDDEPGLAAHACSSFNYDEWGGFFDHVPPPTAPIPAADQLAGNEDGLLGFRVPCIVVSPFARRGTSRSLVLDHTSVLRMIEWRWGLEPLTVRDATANNLADVLDFRRAKSESEAIPAFRPGRSAGHVREKWQSRDDGRMGTAPGQSGRLWLARLSTGASIAYQREATSQAMEQEGRVMEMTPTRPGGLPRRTRPMPWRPNVS